MKFSLDHSLDDGSPAAASLAAAFLAELTLSPDELPDASSMTGAWLGSIAGFILCIARCIISFMLARCKQRLSPNKRHNTHAISLQFHQVPDVFGHTENVDWLSVHFFDDPGAFCLMVHFPVFFLAVGEAVLEDSAVGTAEEGDVFVGRIFLAGAAAVHFGELDWEDCVVEINQDMVQRENKLERR